MLKLKAVRNAVCGNTKLIKTEEQEHLSMQSFMLRLFVRCKQRPDKDGLMLKVKHNPSSNVQMSHVPTPHFLRRIDLVNFVSPEQHFMSDYLLAGLCQDTYISLEDFSLPACSYS